MRKQLKSGTASLVLALGLQAADIPRPAPELAVKTVDGKEQLLSSYKGKVIVVEFLLTTCPHCQKASQLLNKLHKEYGPRGFQPVGVAINEMAQMFVPDYVRSYGLDFPVGYVHRDTAVNYLQHPPMLTFYVPQMVFIDRKFNIRHQYGGNDKFFSDEEKNTRQIIEELLGDARTGSAKKVPPAKKKAS